MHITHLSLTNFRNYGRLELDLPLGTTLLHGDNAQGKTNLLEAIYYLATTRSPHAEQDSQLLNWDAAQLDEPVVVGRLVGHVAANQGKHLIEMRLIQERNQNIASTQRGFRREVLLDRRKVRMMDLLGSLRVVLFLPQDVQLITGSPSNRRRYLDITLCQVDPLYCHTLSHYNKVLEQRNALLRQIAEGSGRRDVLPVFTERLVQLGSELFARRTLFMTELAREAQRIHYEELTQGKETIRLTYLPRLQNNGSVNELEGVPVSEDGEWLASHQTSPTAIAERFGATLQAVQSTEIARGMTIVGPHRDDWGFQINGRSLSAYGSRGQQRSAILALKLAEILWMAAKSEESPVLLLDEVVAELDEHRRALLLAYIQKSSQAIVTATEPGMLTADFMRQATSMTVSNGRVQVDPSHD